MPSGRRNNFPESGRGLGHVTPTIFGSTVGYPSDSLASCYILRCPAPFWLIQCKPYRNRFIIAKVIEKSLGALFYGPLCSI